ncbi:MATE efflux family protein [Artemisia annua]|uniref:MATE efflux family protein n=1 Tax=Artemisia annua TaxID=35608 RepID=A0A2U1KXQ3_ARTAN|nr:MATE efflux family protein [Artemisia annua]
MAAFPVCLQVWLATSLLADCLAAILASAFAKMDYEKVTATASRVLQLGLVHGVALAVLLGVGLHFGARLFTKDAGFVAATQPINALAFVFDSVNFGASDFAYTAYSMNRDKNRTMALSQGNGIKFAVNESRHLKSILHHLRGQTKHKCILVGVPSYVLYDML